MVIFEELVLVRVLLVVQLHIDSLHIICVCHYLVDLAMAVFIQFFGPDDLLLQLFDLI